MADPTSGCTGITQFPAHYPRFIFPSNSSKLDQCFHFLLKSFIECHCYSLEKRWEFGDGIVHFFSVLEGHNPWELCSPHYMVKSGWSEMMQVRFDVFLIPVFGNLSKSSPPHGSQRTEAEMLMFLSTAIPCEVSAAQSAPHGEVNAVPGTGP